MKRNRALIHFVPISLLVLISLWLPACQSESPERPNVVFILADDLGWMDVGYMGSELYETPHIDQLAGEGMLFRNAYAANALCSPTRASILTGMYPARVGIVTPGCHSEDEVLVQSLPESAPPGTKFLLPSSKTRLSTNYFTLGEALKGAGYATGHFGKWHLGPAPYDALHHGFDVDVPNSTVPGPVGGYFSPWVFWETEGPDGEYIEDRMAEEAVSFIRKHKDEPFFLNYWAFSVHTPIDAKREVSGKYYHKLKDLGPDYPQQNAPYAAKVEGLDDAVGKLISTLKDEGIYDNTIIIFYSDNGGYAVPTKEVQTLYWNTPVTSNFPLRKGKGSIYEGGTRIPAIVIWPEVTKPGSISTEVISSIDWYPTILDMLDIPEPENMDFDGISLVPALKEKTLEREALFNFKPYAVLGEDPAVAVIRKPYKLIRFFYGTSPQEHLYELYNLEDDPSEEINLAEEMPHLVSELNEMIDEFHKSTSAFLPVPNPAYKESSKKP